MFNEDEIEEYSKSKTFYCHITDEVIQPARVAYLLGEGVPERLLTSLKGAEITYKPRKIITVDDVGTQFICDKIDNARAWAHERFGDGPSEDTNYLDDIEEKKTKKSEQAITIQDVGPVELLINEVNEEEE
jgi:hypothetical protein